MNIILVAVDTLRADHLGCYGYHRNTSPFIDSLAKNSLLFERCYSQAPWTIPSFSTILSGLYPEQHRVVASPWNVPNATSISFDDSTPMLAELMLDRGYQTAAFDNLHQMASHPRWFNRGFNYYVNSTPRSGLYHHHMRADEINEGVFRWLRNDARPNFFLFLHYWEPHLPYNQPKEFRDRIPAEIDQKSITLSNGRELLPRWGFKDELSQRKLEAISMYDEEILFMDHEIEKLFGALESTKILDDSIVIFTGDHGECMFEHDVLFNHDNLFSATTHVPLIIKAPDGIAKRCPELVEHIDLAPTILAASGARKTEKMRGRNLLEADPFDGKRIVHSVHDGATPRRAFRTNEHLALFEYDWKTHGESTRLEESRYEIYDLKSTDGEFVPVSNDDRQKDVLRTMKQAWLTELLGDASKDPLLDHRISVDFEKYPGDPELKEFYQWVRK
jgi:arylsulfatase A-like enzyme